jgi:transcriptional regulator with XRE-family HTH domain
MHRAPHERLRDLRERKGFATQKQFINQAGRSGYKIGSRRYGAIERGEAKPTINEIAVICLAMNISADAWLMGRYSMEDAAWLTEKEMAIVSALVRGLLGLRN